MVKIHKHGGETTGRIMYPWEGQSLTLKARRLPMSVQWGRIDKREVYPAIPHSLSLLLISLNIPSNPVLALAFGLQAGHERQRDK